MADERDGGQDRTEEPTQRRREEARREGKVARSAELLAAVLVLAGTVTLAGAGGASLARFCRATLGVAAGTISGGELTSAGAIALVRHTTVQLMFALAAVFACVLVAVPATGLVQTRGAVSWKPITPDLSRLSPVSGFRRIVGPDALVGLLKSLGKLAAIGVVAWLAIARSWPELTSLVSLGPSDTARVLRTTSMRVMLWGGLAFLVLSAADWVWQWMQLRKNLRMSRAEVRQDLRETEGDPQVKARQQAIARARARQRMLQQVPRADVVVVNPVHIAVALRYDLESAPAPLVVAMGRRKLAERIKAIAAKHGVPVVENVAVARALIATAKVGKMIPPALFGAIAEILAFVYRRRGRFTLPLGGAQGRDA